MSDIVVRVEGLSKQYRIGALQQRHDSIREALVAGLSGPLRRLRRAGASPEIETIWALRDVSFEVTRGEVVGIIGRNGAGKTTLLKILSRITGPTEGYAEIHGRVGSLLEVGTGFHAELTGRENIYLNGAILGMKKAEIERKFDEILAFSGIEKFIDTPVKRYSSGMYVRLAFSVAAHLEPEILLVDEVLAVGDYDFQKRCLGKMGDLGREGRTVLLVSHNMASIMNLCPRAILLSSGKVKLDGPASSVVHHYIATAQETGGEVVWPDPTMAPGNEEVRLHAVRILTEDGEPTADVDIQKGILIQLTYWNLKEGARLYSAIHLRHQTGTYVLASANHRSFSLTFDPWADRPHPRGLFQSVCRIPGNFLNDGTYSITAIVGTNYSHTKVLADSVVSFRVYDTGATRRESSSRVLGVVRPRLAWHTERKGPLNDELDPDPNDRGSG